MKIDKLAEDMFFRLVKEYADRQGVTEQLKVKNVTEWIGQILTLGFLGEGIIFWLALGMLLKKKLSMYKLMRWRHSCFGRSVFFQRLNFTMHYCIISYNGD